MGSEAIARVIRSGGEANRVLDDLKKGAREAIGLIERLPGAAGQTARALDSLKVKLESGKASGEDLDRLRTMVDSVRDRADRAQKMGARPLSAEERARHPHRSQAELDRAVVTGDRAVFFPKSIRAGACAASGGATGGAAAPTAGGPVSAGAVISDQERAHYRTLGYTDEEISSARRLGTTGPLIIRPPAPPARKPEAPEVGAARRHLEDAAGDRPPARPAAAIRADLEAFDKAIEREASRNTTGDRDSYRESMRQSRDYRALQDELARAEAAMGPEAVGAVRNGARQKPQAGSQPGPGSAQGGGTGAGALDPTVGKTTDELRKLNNEQEKRTRLTKISTMTDTELGKAWKDQVSTLRTLQREIRGTEGSLQVLTSAKQMGIAVDEQQIETQTRAIRRLHARRAEAIDRTGRMESEFGRRGLPIPGAGGIGWRGAAGAFMGGAGFGGGSPGGTLAGMALGYLNPWTAGLALAGMGAGYAWSTARDSYQKRIETLPGTLPIASTMGVDPDSVNDEIARRAGVSRIYRSQELVSAMRTLHRGTGRLDQWRPMVDSATIAGVSPQEQAGMISRLTRQSPGFDRMLPDVLLDAYRLSSIPKGGNDFSRFPLGVDASLLFPFEEMVSGVAGSQAQSPLTMVPMRGLSAQLSAGSYFSVPGIEENSPAKLGATAAMVGGLNQLLSNPQGVFQDLAYAAVQELRGTPAAERLKRDLDIDLDTFAGTWRAIRRSPELAQRTDGTGRHYDEVARAIMGKHRAMFAGPDVYENALMLNAGIDPEVAHQIATKPLEETLGADLWNVGPQAPKPISADAAAMLYRQPAFAAVYEGGGVRDDVTALQTADRSGAQQKIDELGNDLNRTVAEGMERMTDRIVSLLSGVDVTAGREPLGPVER